MEIKHRKKFQGTFNILLFNWPIYALTIAVILSIYVLAFNSIILPIYSFIGITLISIPIITSLIISAYIYDFSGLYSLPWISTNDFPIKSNIATIHAGFDETSEIIKQKIPHTEFHVFDFYDVKKHTEPSIRRARNLYEMNYRNKSIQTNRIPLEDYSLDSVFLIFSAHEIRNTEERINFFKEINRVLKQNGKVYITEHLRDTVNFAAYTFGGFHFLSFKTWEKTFLGSGFAIEKIEKHTLFITNFILKKNGYTS